MVWSWLATDFELIRLERNLVLYLTAVLTVAALAYLGYAMIRPERF